MLHKYTNVSGAPEIKTRRQSPVIGGARLYPGSTVTFTDSELEGLGEATRRLLDAFVMMDPPVLDYEIAPDPMVQQVAAIALEDDGEDAGETGELEEKPDEEASESEFEEGSQEDESDKEAQAEETVSEEQAESAVEASEDEPAEEVEQEENAEESQEGESADKASEDELAPEGEKSTGTAEEALEEESASEEQDTFDYAEFLSGNVKGIKSAFAASDPPIDAAKLIEFEKASDSPRGGLIGWLEQHSN